MTMSTEIDSIGLRVEFFSAEAQRARLNELLSYVMTIDTFYVNHIEHSFGNNGRRVEHRIYSNSTTMATISTGVFQHGKEKRVSVYYIKIVIAGLKSYNDDLDQLRYSFLLSICSWLNGKRLDYRLNELDCDIDARCNYRNFHVMQIKKVPNVRYNDKQIYHTTHYFQKKTKSISALYYDKQVKESLYDKNISRFELKLPSKFFKDTRDLNSLGIAISNVFDRYAVFYFENLNIKDQVMLYQNYIDYNNIPNKAREYDRLVSQLNTYRLFPNIAYIINFINTLYTIKKYKMVVKKKEVDSTIDATESSPFDFEDWKM